MVEIDRTIRENKELGNRRMKKLEELLDKEDMKISIYVGGNLISANTSVQEQGFFGNRIARWEEYKGTDKDFSDNHWIIRIHNEGELDTLKDIFEQMENEFPELNITLKLL